MSEPLFKGIFLFNQINEELGDEKRILEFNPPLKVDYEILEKLDKETGEENYSQDLPILAFSTFDFGMKLETSLDEAHNWLINGYQGLTKESSPEEILMKSIMFDLFHTFFHPSQDPNYGFYHWALYGNLKSRAKALDIQC